MVKSSTTIMAVALLVELILMGLPCYEAQSPLGAPMMSPAGGPMPMVPGIDDHCVTAILNVSDCLSYVSIGSNLTTPDKPCCPEFAGFVESNAPCLCQLVGNAETYGVDVDRAYMLPGACNLPVPSLSACGPASAPAPSSASGAPAGSTAAGPVTDGGASLSPTGSGNGGSNGASSTAVHDLSTLIFLAAAIFIAYYF